MSNLIPMSDMERMAVAVAKSGLFGMRTPEQALALMCVAAAEGMHPAMAARDYHIIQGRPSLKADSMLARFQTSGGKVKWTSYTDQKVAAVFSHPQGGEVEIEWTIERAKSAGLGTKDVWKQYPRQMLRARVISDGVRTMVKCTKNCYCNTCALRENKELEPILGIHGCGHCDYCEGEVKDCECYCPPRSERGGSDGE